MSNFGRGIFVSRRKRGFLARNPITEELDEREEIWEEGGEETAEEIIREASVDAS